MTELIRDEVTDIGFGFYSDDEVKANSRCLITSSVAFDPLNNALPG
jgi:hypothetical protein